MHQKSEFFSEKRTPAKWVFALLIYLTSSTAGCYTWPYNERDLFNPQREYAGEAPLFCKSYSIATADSVFLECWQLSPTDAKINLFFALGRHASLRQMIPIFQKLGQQWQANIISYHYRGIGMTQGRPSVKALEEDGYAVFDFIIEQPEFDRRMPFWALGDCLGTFGALKLGGCRNLDGIILLAPFPNVEEVITYGKKAHLPFFARPLIQVKVEKPIYGLDNVAAIEHLQQPILFIHGAQDHDIPAAMSRRLFAACPS